MQLDWHVGCVCTSLSGTCGREECLRPFKGRYLDLSMSHQGSLITFRAKLSRSTLPWPLKPSLQAPQVSGLGAQDGRSQEDLTARALSPSGSGGQAIKTFCSPRIISSAKSQLHVEPLWKGKFKGDRNKWSGSSNLVT